MNRSNNGRKILNFILMIVKMLYPYWIFMGAAAIVKIFFDNSFNVETNSFIINSHNISSSDLLAITTFLFGTILTFDMHHYDQIEPKYESLEQKENEKGKIKKFKVETLTHLMGISVLNISFIIQFFISFDSGKAWFTSEELVLTTFFADIVYLAFSLARQFGKWLENLRND